MSLSSPTAERPTSPAGPPAPVRRRRGAGDARRKTALVLVGLLALGSAAGLMRGLTSCAPTAPTAEKARPLTAAEAQRLAGMRRQNYRDGRVGLRIELGRPGRQTRLAGWIDWHRSALSLAVAGPTAASDGLVQAAPGLIATRTADPKQPATAVAAGAASAPTTASGPTTAPTTASGTGPTAAGDSGAASAPPAAGAPTGASAAGSATARPAATPNGGAVAVRDAPEPPARLPADRWRARPLRAPTGAAAPLDTLVSLLFTVASPEPDSADVLAQSESRWLARDTDGDTKLDVLLGPAVPPAGPPATPTTTPSQTPGGITTTLAPPTSLASMGGAVRYWLDADSRLHRFEALFGPDLPVRVRLLRDQAQPFALAQPLGGAPITPRSVTVAEGRTLAHLRQRDRATGGGAVRVTLPTVDGGVRQATGWLDWRTTVAYLMVHDPDRPGPAALLRADAAGVATRKAPKTAAAKAPKGAAPPLPPPRNQAWAFADWAHQRDAGGTYDLHLLINEALSLSARGTDDAAAARKAARWLRADLIGGTRTAVYEIPKPAEKGVAAGQARMRYWVDRDGVLRRLELRTRSGAFARLDIEPGTVPVLSRVPLA
ncbi:hypothetical protein [Rhizomonospora bruguierae]|uniref:hypothetical protein n=1 Tax=Rhizomonospora bruguierae TaxID=1581705 RepID=UPI001BCB6382|nr:hypothetical protein [Micromonospora sp. NBRC 107566]